MQYLRTIREQLSAAYHAGATFGMLRDFDDKAAISITANAGLNPEKADTAITYFFKGVEEVEKQVDAADLQKVKEILLKQAGVDEKNNAYWLGVLANYTGLGFNNHTGYKEFVKNLRGQQVSDFLKNVLMKSGNHVEVIMKLRRARNNIPAGNDIPRWDIIPVSIEIKSPVERFYSPTGLFAFFSLCGIKESF